MTHQQAFSLYINYQTTTPQYKAFAAQLGYTVGDLNKRFATELYQLRNKG